MDKFIKFDGVSFNQDYIKRRGSEAEFLKEAEKNPHWFENDPKRIEKLKEVYALANKKEEQPQSQNANKPA